MTLCDLGSFDTRDCISIHILADEVNLSPQVNCPFVKCYLYAWTQRALYCIESLMHKQVVARRMFVLTF